MTMVMLCAALLPTVEFKLIGLGFCLFCCKLVMKCECETCTCKKRTHVLVVTTCRYRSSTVLIMSQENHSTIRTLLSKRCQTEVTSAMEVVCCCCLFAGGVAISKSPPPKGFIVIFLIIKITQ
jgi:hypothetical protein